MAKIRESYSADKNAAILSSALAGWLKDVKVHELFQTCLTCSSLGVGGTSCKLYPGHPLPAHVALTGCEKYDEIEPRRDVAPDDDIPF